MFSKLSFNFLLGKPALIILAGIFFALWIYFSIYPDHPYSYIFTFYFVGCLIIGPIEVIFAYFLSILLQYPTINITQMWIGFSISFLVPGTHLNIGIYFGSLIDGIWGGVLAAIFLYIPCFLFLLGMLPQWKYYR
jgi:chromate transporter